MTKMPYLESSSLPSQLNTSPVTGVAGQLSSVAEKTPQYDGVTLESMRGNPLYQRHTDDIDKVGLAQKEIISKSKTIKSNMKRIRAFNEMASKVKIPKEK